MKILWSCRSNAKKYKEDHLPVGDLHDLPKDIANSLADFHDKIHAHFEDKTTKLAQLEILEDEAFELVPE